MSPEITDGVQASEQPEKKGEGVEKQSSISTACQILGLDPNASFQDVETAFHAEDQRLIQSNSWDHTDPSANINKVAHLLETIAHKSFSTR